MKSSPKTNKEYACAMFRKLYISKWQSHGKTQAQFAEEINNRRPSNKAKCDNNTVSLWLRKEHAPVRYLHEICQIFDVDISVFYFDEHDQKYQYSPAFADEVAKDLEEKAKKDFKLDLTFIQGLKNIIPDFDSRFPVCTPLVFREFDSRNEYFKRPSHAEAAPASKRYKLLQINHDGRNQFLSVFDLKILKDVQAKVKDYVCAIFEETAADLVKREEEANRRYIEVNSNIWIGEFLSDDDLQKIDPYGFYTEAERKKYHIEKHKIEHYTTGGRIINEDEQEDNDDGDSRA